MAYDSVRQRPVLFGGARRGGGFRAETWEWDGVRWSRVADTGPSARIGHSMTWSKEAGGIVLYGGFSQERPFRDLWRWDGRNWFQLDSSGPAHTEGPAIASLDGSLTLIGVPAAAGSAKHQTFSTWVRRNGGWEQVADPGPPFRIGQGLAVDASRSVIVLFGGAPSERDSPLTETWEFKARQWTRVPR